MNWFHSGISHFVARWQRYSAVGQWVGAVVRVDCSERGGDARLVGSGDVGQYQ